MGFFDMLFSGIGSLFSVAVGVVSEVVSTVKTYFAAKEIIIKTVYDERDKKQEQIHELNQEIQFLRRKLNENGRITDQQRKRLHELGDERNFLKQGIKSDSQIIAADKFQQNEENIHKVEIGLETTHVLQWNAFADTMAKSCPKCQRPMKLQWARNLVHVNPQDFYWGCTGWYFNNQQIRLCEYRENLSQQDLALMTDTSAPEFSLSAQDFNIILHDHSTSESIIERMDDLQSDLRNKKQGIKIVCCPMHAEPMILQKKKNGIGLLDQYYLRCPHWAPNDQGCSYMEKLKSGSQLAALLKHQTGTGIL
ncbi:hypothetical protein AYK86_05795 [Acinetobacter venetianus]|uniref:hypothetical protein n=1 Tax=Acinetobacter venetianus TaxID=52133 RepID=UPI000775D429|nr:hypothetical protein [Acinetobacter venetianus]KXO85181.1 hypothetical protein AYK86_05795 [Acinetobacter venetianus]